MSEVPMNAAIALLAWNQVPELITQKEQSGSAWTILPASGNPILSDFVTRAASSLTFFNKYLLSN